jgi:hypothetical protein
VFVLPAAAGGSPGVLSSARLVGGEPMRGRYAIKRAQTIRLSPHLDRYDSCNGYLQRPHAVKYQLYPIGSLDMPFLSLFICDERHLSSRQVIRDLMSLPKQQEQRTENKVTGGDGSFVT